MGKIFYIMGKSASGKDRIYSILSKDESLGLKRLVLYTTRPIRAGEETAESIILQMRISWRNSEKPTG